MKSNESLYTQLTDRRLSLDERLNLVEHAWSNHSKQMLFDWLAGLMINRKKSGIDSVQLVHRIWNQLHFCLKHSIDDQVTIKPSFIKAIIETLSNENGESNSSAMECCLFISRHGKELDYKYDQLVSLLLIVLTKYNEHEDLLTILLDKYWSTIRVQGNITKRLALWTLNPATPVQIWVFQDLCKQLLVPFLNVRLIYPSLSILIENILRHIIFHRTWTSAYREYMQSVSMKKNITCPVSPLFNTLETLITSVDLNTESTKENLVRFLPSVFRHCVNLVDQEKIGEIFDLLVQMNSWLEKLTNSDVYFDGIGRLLEILDEKHVIDQLLIDSMEERITNWMSEILFKSNSNCHSESFAKLAVICLHLHPTLIESNLKQILQSIETSEIFLVGYIDLYAQMRSLPKLTKRLTQTFDRSIRLPSNVLQHYRKCISECSHTLVDEIWSSLLDHSTEHLILIQLLSSLLEGYRLFDLNIPRAILFKQIQTKYDRTLEKLRFYANDSTFVNDVNTRFCVIKCYLSLGWFSICLLSFSSTIPPVDDHFNHNGSLLSFEQWNSLESDVELRPILFSLSCQRIYRLIMSNQMDIDSLVTFSSTPIFEQFEAFFDFLSETHRYKLVQLYLREHLERPNVECRWLISNENRLKLFVRACVEHLINQNCLTDEKSSKKRKKIDWDDEPESFYNFLRSKSIVSDQFETIVQFFSDVYFDRIQSMTIRLSIGWFALNSKSSMQILLDLIRSTSKFPSNFIDDLLTLALKENQSKMLDELVPIVLHNENYRKILQKQIEKLLDEMKTNDEAKNVRLLEKYHHLFSLSQRIISTNVLRSIIDRLIDSSSNSMISYSILDTRYLLAMIILNCFEENLSPYLTFLHQTWTTIKSDLHQGEHLQSVIIAYAKRWQTVLNHFDPLENLQLFLNYFNDRFELISNLIQTIPIDSFQQWIEQICQCFNISPDQNETFENYRQTLNLLEKLSHCSLTKDQQVYFQTIINKILSECGPILIRLSNDHRQCIEIVSIMLNFATNILNVKRLQIRSQVALSLLQCSLHLSPSVLFATHSKVCKLLSLLIKFHSQTLCKHVPVVETILKMLLQSIVERSKDENEEILIEAARETTKLASHLIEQCKEDFRSTIVYVLIDYVHLLSKGRNLSADLKKNLHGTAFELFRISGERVEQYSGQMSVAEREHLKQLQQQYKQYHMFKGTV